MKFTHSLKFNSVPEWRSNYINYHGLKKALYRLTGEITEPSAEQEGEGQDEEQALEEPLLESQHSFRKSPDFLSSLESELARVIAFYHEKEHELCNEVDNLELQVQGAEALATGRPLGSLGPERRVTLWRGAGQKAQRDELKVKLTDLYVQLKGLEDFISLNRDGFRKIVKKHDKVNTTAPPLKNSFLYEPEFRRLEAASKEGLDKAMAKVLEVYAVVAAEGDQYRAEAALKKHLRDIVTFERNTVWRDMMALERKSAAAHVKPATPMETKPWYITYHQPLWLCIASLVLAVLQIFPYPFTDPTKQACLSLLAFVSLLWCTEAIPLFVTSMVVPLLVVVLRVLQDKSQNPPARLTPQQAAPAIFHAMFSQVIMLLLGGFAIAAALSKHFIAKRMAVAILSRVGRRPSSILLAVMMVATFASMWISNVAAPVLCFSLVQPILRTLPPTHAFAKSLVMGIALASNVGGMTSPISSPQNIFAIERMSMDGEPPSWLQWFAVALPVSLVSNVLLWWLLRVIYKPDAAAKEVRPLKPSDDPISGTQVYVVVVSVLTVGLWCCNSFLQEWLGEMGVVAVLPLVAFFGFGVLDKDDFNAFLWNVVMLAMGGLAVGEAVKSSGLLQSIAEAVQHLVDGLPLFTVMAIFCAMVLVCTSFISHTVGAMVILPILQSVGETMGPEGHPKLLVMAAGLCCSAAMGLPVSGFPNMTAVALEDATGVNYVGLVDFLKVGVPGSVIAYAVIVTLGYQLMGMVGF